MYESKFYFSTFPGMGSIAAADTSRFAVANLVKSQLLYS